jgi:hypothetical protein
MYFKLFVEVIIHLAKITAMLFSTEKIDTTKAEAYWAPVANQNSDEELDRKQRIGMEIWSDIFKIDPATVDADFLEKHNILPDVNVNNIASFGRIWKYISTGHPKYTHALKAYWVSMGETLLNMEFVEDGDMSTDVEIKAGIQVKLKWFSGNHPSVVFPTVPLLSQSIVDSIGQLFLQVNQALFEVCELFSCHLWCMASLWPSTTVSGP